MSKLWQQFEKTLGDWAAAREHRLTPPKSPQTSGMVEQFSGRIEEGM